MSLVGATIASGTALGSLGSTSTGLTVVPSVIRKVESNNADLLVLNEALGSSLDLNLQNESSKLQNEGSSLHNKDSSLYNEGSSLYNDASRCQNENSSHQNEDFNHIEKVCNKTNLLPTSPVNDTQSPSSFSPRDVSVNPQPPIIQQSMSSEFICNICLPGLK